MGPLEMPPKPGTARAAGVPCQPSPPASCNLLYFLPGPALRGPADSDAVLHLCCDRNAGRTGSPVLHSSVSYFPSPLLSDALFPLTSPLSLTIPIPPLSVSETKKFIGIGTSPKWYPIGSRVNGQERNIQLKELLSPFSQAWGLLSEKRSQVICSGLKRYGLFSGNRKKCVLDSTPHLVQVS